MTVLLHLTVQGMRRKHGGRTMALTDTQRAQHPRIPEEDLRKPVRPYRTRLSAMIAAAGVAVVIFATSAVFSARHRAGTGHPVPQHPGLPSAPGSYIGLYAHGTPDSFAPVKASTTGTGVKARVVA